MNIQRWTLAVVCAATAMLMLDIAVVNTALSRIAEDLDTGLSGLQWVVDAYTLALASVVLTAGSLADRLGRRRLFTIGLAHLHRRLAGLRAGAGHRDAQHRPRGAGHRRGDHVRRLAGAARPRVPGPAERAGALAAYGATIGASFAVGPLVGGVLTSGLDWQWIFLVNIPIGVACLWITRTLRRGVARPARARHRLARPDHAHRRPVPARARAPARQRGRLGHDADRRRAGRRRGRADRVRRVELRVREPMLPLRLFRDALVHRRADRRVRDLGVVLRDLPLHDALPAADPRAVGDRGRPRLPARARW